MGIQRKSKIYLHSSEYASKTVLEIQLQMCLVFSEWEFKRKTAATQRGLPTIGEGGHNPIIG